MKMKRFTAPEMRQVIQAVNDELGPDALILSNRQVADGVEIIAAIDYEDELLANNHTNHENPRLSSLPDCEEQPAATSADAEQSAAAMDESQPVHSPEPALAEMQREIKSLRNMLEVPLSQLAWAELGRREPYRAAILKRLTEMGLHPVIANRITDQVGEINNEKQAWQRALSILEDLIPVKQDDLLTQGGVVALVGPTGVGKTTTVAKLAARFALRHGRRHVALVTMDHYRIGAHDQLRTYGRLLGVPVYIAGDQEELQVIVNQMRDRKLILIDTAGASQRDIRLTEQFAALEVDDKTIKRYLVLSATGQLSLHDEVIRSFNRFKPDLCILTKLDEATSLGGLLSVLMKHKLPVAYTGEGQRVPDDFHPARARRLLAQADALADDTRKAQSDEIWMQAFGVTEVGVHAHAHA